MGNVIDELIVELKLDPKQFDQAQKDQVRKLREFEREHERHSKKLASDTGAVTQAFSLLQGRLLAIAGLFMGGMGITQFTEHITRLTVQTGLLAQSLGLSTSQITKWQGVGATVGAAPGEMAQAIASVRNAQSDLRNGVPSQMQKFAYMTHNNPGPAVDFTKDTDPDEFMIGVARWLEYHKKQGPQSYAAANRAVSTMLGFGQGTINTLDLGPDELRKRLKEMEKFAPTPDQIKRFKELQEAFGHLEQSSLALGRAFVDKLQPTILMIIKLLDKLANLLHPADDAKVKAFTDDKLPEMGGSRSIFGRIKRWWNGGDKGGSPAGADHTGAGGGAVSAPGGAANDNVGAGLGGSEFLKARRKRMMDEINADPELRRKVAAMAVTEGARDPTPVIESLFNRADYEGKSIREMLTPKFYGPMRIPGKLESASAQLDRDRRLNARIQGAIDAVGGGSHIIGGRTDQGLPTDPNGMWGYGTPAWMKRGGNVYTDWGGGRGGHAGAAAYRRMIEQGIARDTTPALPDASAPTGGNAGAFDRWGQINRLTGAGAALRTGGGTVNNNTRSNQTHIGNMHVTVPPGADPAGYGRGISEELQRYDTVMHANEGVL